MKKKLIKIIRIFANALPRPLPNTGLEFDDWVDDILHTYGFRDDDTYREFIASTIMHLDHKITKVSKVQIANALTRQIANNVAYGKIEQFRKETKAKAQAKAVNTGGNQGVQDIASQVVS